MSPFHFDAVLCALGSLWSLTTMCVCACDIAAAVVASASGASCVWRAKCAQVSSLLWFGGSRLSLFDCCCSFFVFFADFLFFSVFFLSVCFLHVFVAACFVWFFC